MKYVITNFKDVAQAKAIYKSLSTDGYDDPTEEYIDYDRITNYGSCWVVVDNELIVQMTLSVVDSSIQRISATLYCVLKNI